MAESTKPNKTSPKLFPRNLTARADYVVRGNPVTSRPEDGVENCYPGLEYDSRNLEARFFPGLTFEFHRPEGANLCAMTCDSAPVAAGLAAADIERGLYLWAIQERAVVDDSGDLFQPLRLDGLKGGAVWRRVRELASGRIAILIGTQPGATVRLGEDDPLYPAIEELRRCYNFGDDSKNHVERDPSNDIAVKWAVFVGKRVQVLDPASGVIDVAVYEPGDLTRTLCVPWQYDFRECGCFYWAASKPDIVTVGDTNPVRHINFQRHDRHSPVEDVPPPDVVAALDQNWWSRRWWEWRAEQELDATQLIMGAWHTKLPVVLNDREVAEDSTRSTEPTPADGATPS